MRTEIVKTIKKLSIFILIFIATDMIFGNAAKTIFFSQKTGKYARLTNAIENADADLLVMGNSHANRHYHPKVLQDSLHLRCYNAGVQGQGILFQLALQTIIYENYSPEIIILNIDENWLYASEQAYDRMAELNPYYSKYRKQLRPIFSMDSTYHEIPLFLKSYQMNSTLVHAIRYFIAPQKDIMGYVPLEHIMHQPKQGNSLIQPIETSFEQKNLDDTFCTALELFRKNALSHNTQVIFTVSPNLYPKATTNSMKYIEEFANKFDIPFITFNNNKTFLYQYRLFNDPNHLNNDGAILYSGILSEEIKKIL